jgi:hypothetical protein
MYKIIISILILLTGCIKQLEANFFIETNLDGTPKEKSKVYITNTREGLLNITECVLNNYSGGGSGVRYYIQLDNSGRPISGTLTTKKPNGRKFVDITPCSNKKADNYYLDENTLYGAIIVGHSISTNMSYGNSGVPASFSNINFGNNKKVQWSSGETSMEVVDNVCVSGGKDRLAQRIFQPSYHGDWNPIILITNEVAKRVKQRTGKNIQFITISGSANGSMTLNNGYGYQQLGNNSIHYQYLRQGIQAAKDYATSIGKAFKVAFVFQISGEGDLLNWGGAAMNEEIFKTNFIKYHRQLKATIDSISGVSNIYKVYRHQQHMNLGSDSLNMLIKQAQIDFNDSNSPVVFPMTCIDNAVGYEHPGTYGTFKFSGIVANNIYKDIYEKKFVQFKAKQFTVVGNSIKIKFDVPVPPIRIDNSRGGTPVAETFQIYVSGNPVVINSVVVSGADELTLNCAGSPTGGIVYYKYTRPYLGTDPYGRNQSDIVDSDPATFYGINTPNFLLSFKKQL